jgi:type II secretory pathway pseudopilin PulG
MMTSSREHGFTVVETLVALLLTAVGVLAVAPLFLYAMDENVVGSQYGTLGAAAVDRMELLRELPFFDPQLAAGGSLTGDSAGYFDASDPDLVVRWQIVNNASPDGTKTVTVRAVARTTAVGAKKLVTMTTVRGK